MNQSEFERLSGLTEMELLEEVGFGLLEQDESLAARFLGQRMTYRERATAAAREWFVKNGDILRARICGNEKLRAAFSSDPGAYVELAKLVADALLGVVAGLPLITISMLIARKGLDSICVEDTPSTTSG